MLQSQVRHQRVNVLVVAEHRALAGRHNVHQTGGGVQIVRRHARAVLVAHPLRLVAAAAARRASAVAVGTVDTGAAAAATAAQLRTAASRRAAGRSGRRGVGRCGGPARRRRLTFAEQKRRRFAEAQTGPTGVRGAHLALRRPLHGLVSLDLAALLQRVELLWVCASISIHPKRATENANSLLTCISLNVGVRISMSLASSRPLPANTVPLLRRCCVSIPLPTSR